MAVSMSLFVVDPDRGPVDEADFGTEADLAALLDPANEAGVEIVSGSSEIILRDSLDDLVAGLCLGGGKALTSGGSYANVSLEGFDTATIAADGDTARFESGGDEMNAPLDETLAAMRALAGRFASILRQEFPDDTDRRERLEAFAAG